MVLNWTWKKFKKILYLLEDEKSINPEPTRWDTLYDCVLRHVYMFDYVGTLYAYITTAIIIYLYIYALYAAAIY